MNGHSENVALGPTGNMVSIEVQAEPLGERLESERSVELVCILPVLERQQLNLAAVCFASAAEHLSEKA